MAVLNVCASKAQDSAALTQAVVILSSRDELLEASNQYKLDSATRVLNLGRRLDEALAIAGLTVNNYGPGLATLTHRGFTSSQVSVRWEGLEMNNAALGLADLSLRFLTPSTQISFQSAVSTSNFGGSGIGGALVQRHEWQNSKLWQLSLQGVSFGNVAGSVYLENKLGKERPFRYYLAYQTVNNENLFDYFSNVERRLNRLELDHAQHQQHTLQAGFQKDFSLKSSLRFHLEAVSSKRQIPATVGAFSDATQVDKQGRVVLAYLWRPSNKVSQVFRVGYNLESILYSSERTRIYDTLLLHALQFQSSTIWDISKSLRADFEAGTWISQLLKSGGVAEQVGQVRTHAFGMLKYQKPYSKTSLAGSYRIENLPGSGLLHLPKIGVAYKFSPKINWYGFAALTGRYPTLNDRFWTPGGNQGLKPEKGRAIGLAFKWQQGAKFSLGLEGEWNALKNRIVWLPQPQETWWSPQQQPSFQSITESINLTYKLRLKAVELQTQATASYSQFTLANTAANEVPLYAPQISGGGSIAVLRKHLLCQVSGNYTGKRYTSTDASDSLPGFYLVNIHAAHPIANFKKWQLQGQIGVNNLLNRAFESVENRPMPLRHFHAKITLQTRNDHE